MKNVLQSKDISTQIGVGEGGGRLAQLGSILNNFAKGFGGIIAEQVTLNGEAKTPVVFGDDEPAELFSDEVGSDEYFDISGDTTVTFTVDGVAKTEIEFSANDIIDNLEEATVDEIVEFMQDAIEEEEEDDDYWVEKVGSGEEAQIRVYSLGEEITDNKIEIGDAAHENTTLGFDENDIDYGKQGIGEDVEYDGDYAILTKVMDAETGETIGIDDIESDGFSLICSDTSKDYDIGILTAGTID